MAGKMSKLHRITAPAWTLGKCLWKKLSKWGRGKAGLEESLDSNPSQNLNRSAAGKRTCWSQDREGCGGSGCPRSQLSSPRVAADEEGSGAGRGGGRGPGLTGE